jgi:hypothetical protein
VRAEGSQPYVGGVPSRVAGLPVCVGCCCMRRAGKLWGLSAGGGGVVGVLLCHAVVRSRPSGRAQREAEVEEGGGVGVQLDS